MKITTIDKNMYARLLMFGAENLKAHRAAVNELNVFPVPDGDTGDNMYMTINSGANAAHGGNLSEVAEKSSYGMLLGARGNSGVILSRIFAGIAKGFAGLDTADINDFSRAFNLGIEEAYKAVVHPVEGTILSVFKDGVRAADRMCGFTSDIGEYIDALIAEAEESLARTPELLPILKDAGVVDSGGAGFVYIAQGMKKAIGGEELKTSADEISDKTVLDFSAFTENSTLDYGYCTEFLLRLQASKVDIGSFDESVITDYLKSVGESVVAFRDGTVFKAHVHTENPGDVLNFCRRYGEFLTVKIENMSLQHNEILPENSYSAPKIKKKCGTVAVCTGDGLKRLFSEIGADAVISGGQSMNPSSEEFIRAFDEVNAETIFVFPNNKNIFLAARQAAELYGKSDIYIVPSTNVGEGYVALASIDMSKNPSDVLLDADDAIHGIRTCMVSRASRDVPDIGAAAGDFIGFEDDEIYSSSADRKAAVTGLLDKMNAGARDVIILACGEDVPEDEISSLYGILTEKYKNTEIITVDGGQPVYDYIIILE